MNQHAYLFNIVLIWYLYTKKWQKDNIKVFAFCN